MLVITGCPHNQYSVELTPRGPLMERKLTFYREDGTDTNGLPNYQLFPRDELATIGRFYKPGAITRKGERRTVVGRFASAMPGDVGGAGSYLNLSNSLGNAAIYAERFRGDDDLTARMEKRSRAADQLTDLIIGWSERELGHEQNFRRLRHFLDSDFRRDVKNLSFYTWMLQASAAAKGGAMEEFPLRFGQYLVERGYLKVEDSPDIFPGAADDSPQRLMVLIQRLVAAKLGITRSEPMPPGLAMLADSDAAWKSWVGYLRTTPVYRARLRHWQKEKVLWGMRVAQQEVADFLKSRGQTNSLSHRSAAPAKPDPSDVAAELTLELLENQFLNMATEDHLLVRLSLRSAPTHSNGKWDEAGKQVLWESDLEERTNAVRLPMFCYASWSEPDDRFQGAHFGSVILRGEELIQYCLWRSSLNSAQAAEWDVLLSEPRPVADWTNRLAAFRFSSESGKPQNSQPSASLADLPRELIQKGLTQKAEAPTGGKN